MGPACNYVASLGKRWRIWTGEPFNIRASNYLDSFLMYVSLLNSLLLCILQLPGIYFYLWQDVITEVDLLWSTASIFLIPGIWHSLGSVTWAGSRFWRSIDPLLLERRTVSGRWQAPGPLPRGRSLYMNFPSFPNTSAHVCSHVSPWPWPKHLQRENLPFEAISGILQGVKETRLLYLNQAFGEELCPWKYLLTWNSISV